METKVKVLTVITRMNVGGPAKLLVGLINGENPDRIEHEILTGHCEQNEIDFLTEHKVNCKVTYLPTYGRNISLLNEIKTFFALASHFRKVKPDIIHTHTAKAGFLGRLAAILFFPRARRVHTFHGHLLYGYFSPTKTQLIISMEKILSLFTDNLIAVSNQIMIDLKSRGIGKEKDWRVIPPCVSNSNFPRNHQKTYELVWVGRFTEVKDPEFFISVVKELAQNGIISDSSPALMIGGGELLPMMELCARENNLPVRFLGWLDDALLEISKSKLLAITSRNEGLPVVMLEAASVGVPTISTNVGGISDFIQDGVSGFFGPRDVVKYSLRIQDILKKNKLLVDVGREAEILQRKYFSTQIYIDSHATLYLERAR